MEGLLLLKDSIGKERRPISWVAGSQEIIKPEPLNMRELKSPLRMKANLLDEPNRY
jgi:NADH-quinone oxidoreductase subunit B